MLSERDSYVNVKKHGVLTANILINTMRATDTECTILRTSKKRYKVAHKKELSVVNEPTQPPNHAT